MCVFSGSGNTGISDADVRRPCGRGPALAGDAGAFDGARAGLGSRHAAGRQGASLNPGGVR